MQPGPTAFLATPLAGLSGGEAVSASVAAEPGAGIVVTSQGPQALLKTESPARYEWLFEVGERATVTFLPWMTIPYPGSKSETRVDVRIAPGGAFVGWDAFAVGRVARGEAYAFDGLASEYRVEAARELLLHERSVLSGSDREQLAAVMAGRTHVGSLYLAGFEQAIDIQRIRELLRPSTQFLAGATAPDPRLMLVRVLADSGEAIERCLWPVVRAALEARGAGPLDEQRVGRRWMEPA